MNKPTILWHDYETWGVNPRVDQPAQFAAIRTDLDLNEVERPIEIFCKPTYDRLPNPQAVMVTGISPLRAEQQGYDEPEFIRRVIEAFMQPNTCGAGYNSIRFDDEVTRFTAYRNFYDPYEREYKNDNSRWDLVNVMRMVHALRPEGINWPKREDGHTSFKLEHLTAANNIEHAGAHDALVDVRATIEVARLLKRAQPKFYEFAFNNRDKHKCRALINQPAFIHTSAMLGPDSLYTAPMVCLGWSTTNANEAYCVQIGVDNQWLIDASIDEIREVLYTKKSERPEGKQELGIKKIQINRCPALAPLAMLKDQSVANRLGITFDEAACEAERWKSSALTQKIAQVFERHFDQTPDVESGLYDGFPSPNDKQLFSAVRAANADSFYQPFVFDNKRYNELLFRYRARFFPQTLDFNEQHEWRELLTQRFTTGSDGFLSIDDFQAQVQDIAIRANEQQDQRSMQLVNDLLRFQAKIMGS